jgi:hypothetical protein
VTKEDFDEWMKLPETVEFFSRLKERHNETLMRWSQGMFTGSSSDETVQLNAHAIGEVTILSEILESDYDSIKGEE